MSKKNRKFKGRRKNSKFPNLDNKLNRINLRQYLDMDYLDKLNDEEKLFLDTFIKNEYTADFSGDNNLINKKKERKKIYNNNNARNKDYYNFLMIAGRVIKDTKVMVEKASNPEDAIIEMIDLLKKSK